MRDVINLRLNLMEGAQLSKCVLYTWGANSHAQLGQGHTEDQAEPRRADVGLQAEKIRCMTGGGGHSALITESGDLLMCGQNHKGQLGLSHTTEVITFQLCPLPGGKRVQQVSCGWDFSVILTGDNGQVWACGSNAFGQLGVSPRITHSAELLHVKTLKEPVTSVAAGLRHTLASTASGCVYQWGTGLSSHAKRMLNPQPVPAHLSSKEPCIVPGFDHVTSQKVVAGSTHCICLTVEGDVFLWGSNKHGQLVSESLFLPLPVALDRSLLQGERVIDVHSGWTHLVAVTESGRVFTWGRSNYGQLGQTNLSTEKESDTVTSSGHPVEVKALFGATQIACGSEHNLALVGGRIFSWGWNEHGMCGDGSLFDVTQPRPIPHLRDASALLIGCGAGHSMALCSLKSNEDSAS
ncbi:secretion-regulating guanine nucleotide exchange factor isoform X1 [Carassius gibelio]|uniref:secretion-regulating guanine nucleotide exchange factor isoform X1 n=1 Tax=Carassius gibelio TaxID=101364 RepID=UPI00227825F7|nr:secretion-regulating guanine nucleotide exchange factor isoform X1 [Carassius gibelio]XP_052400224.1 secretion-regulating guanine nucleotide exchange factor isoform X1 [Carassius gibelio]